MLNKAKVAQTNRTQTQSVLSRGGVLAAGAASLLIALGACTPRTGPSADGAAYVPATGSARGLVDLAALPGKQSDPAAASTAGSEISQSNTATVPRTGQAQGIRVPNAR